MLSRTIYPKILSFDNHVHFLKTNLESRKGLHRSYSVGRVPSAATLSTHSTLDKEFPSFLGIMILHGIEIIPVGIPANNFYNLLEIM
jgi:hypothetical protein